MKEYAGERNAGVFVCVCLFLKLTIDFPGSLRGRTAGSGALVGLYIVVMVTLLGNHSTVMSTVWFRHTEFPCSMEDLMVPSHGGARYNYSTVK